MSLKLAAALCAFLCPVLSTKTFEKCFKYKHRFNHPDATTFHYCLVFDVSNPQTPRLAEFKLNDADGRKVKSFERQGGEETHPNFRSAAVQFDEFESWSLTRLNSNESTS